MRIFALLLALIAAPALAATGDKITPLGAPTYAEEFSGPLEQATAGFRNGIGIYVGQPQTMMHIGTGEKQAAFNGNYLGLGIETLRTPGDGVLRAVTKPLTSSQKKAWQAAIDRALLTENGKKLAANYVRNMRAVTHAGYALTTQRTFKPPFYAEVRANVATAPGQWPGFYAFDFGPIARYWPIEIDAMEKPDKPDSPCYYGTLHYGKNPHSGQRLCGPTVLASKAHRYGIFVGTNELIWYLDGVEMRRLKTPGQSSYAFSLVITNSLDGWPRIRGNPPKPNGSATDYYDYLRVWQGTIAEASKPAP